MKNGTMKRLISASIFAGAALAFASTAQAAVPQTITHQGRLYDSKDAPVNGTLDVKFAIYADASSPDPIWTETHVVIAVPSRTRVVKPIKPKATKRRCQWYTTAG